MMNYDTAVSKFWEEFNSCKTMVLSTSLRDIVTSRMMSVVVIDGCLYFQTDIQARKYTQLKENPHTAFCIDNIQMEGICTETGHPADDPAFCSLYEKCFPGSFRRYTNLKSERLFRFEPAFIERWIYLEGKPYLETIDLVRKEYTIREFYAD